MLRYTLKRIVGVLPTLIIVVTFVFFFVRMIPGDPARLVAGEQATLDAVEAVRVQLGLDQPIHIQYLKGSYGTVDLGATMALILMSIIPVIIFYLSCQKYIIKGVAAGAVKG